MIAKVVQLDFEKRGGLLPVIVQDFTTGEVLMLAYTDPPGYNETLASAQVVLYSTSKKKRWKKGETSGDLLQIIEMITDCDADALLYRVRPVGGAACHTGARSCFFRKVIYGETFLHIPKPDDNHQVSLKDAIVHPSLIPH